MPLRPIALFPRRPIRAAGLFAAGLALAAGAMAFAPLGQQQAPAQPQAPTLRFAHGGNAAEIPMELASNAVFVPVQVNQGQPASWLLDTGLPETVADSSISAGAAPAPLSLALPGLAILGARPDSRSLAPLGPWYGIRLQGALGDDVLSQLVVELDYDRRSVEFYQPGAYHPPRHVLKLDLEWIDGLPTVRARLRLAGRTIEGNFALNTGASAGVQVSRKVLETTGVYRYLDKLIPGNAIDASGVHAELLARADWLDLGSARVSQPIVSIGQAAAPQSESPVASHENEKGKKRAKGKAEIVGWIGGEILRKFNSVFDFPAGRVYFAPNRDFVFPILADASGATIIAAGPKLGEFVVRDVAPGSPAAAAGLLPGDQILVINGEPTSDFTLEQVRELLSKPGDKPIFSVLRLGQKMRIDLTLRSRL